MLKGRKTKCTENFRNCCVVKKVNKNKSVSLSRCEKIKYKDELLVDSKFKSIFTYNWNYSLN
jgi:hypothetical protein